MSDSDTDFTIQARLHSWTTPGIGDWVAGSALSGKALLATFPTSGWTLGAYNDLTSEAAFVDNIDATGVTQILVSSDRHSTGTQPGGDEHLQYQAPEEAGTTETPSSP